MAKKYLYSFLLIVGLATTVTVFAQEKQSGKAAQESNIDGLSIYPNPVSGDRIYITTKLNEDKEITIFDVLGKKVLQTELTSKELNIGSLNPGIYIIQIKEEDAVATRKLIVK